MRPLDGLSAVQRVGRPIGVKQLLDVWVEGGQGTHVPICVATCFVRDEGLRAALTIEWRR